MAKRQLSVRIDPELLQKIEAYVVQENTRTGSGLNLRTRNEMIGFLLERGLETVQAVAQKGDSN